MDRLLAIVKQIMFSDEPLEERRRRLTSFIIKILAWAKDNLGRNNGIKVEVKVKVEVKDHATTDSTSPTALEEQRRNRAYHIFLVSQARAPENRDLNVNEVLRKAERIWDEMTPREKVEFLQRRGQDYNLSDFR